MNTTILIGKVAYCVERGDVYHAGIATEHPGKRFPVLHHVLSHEELPAGERITAIGHLVRDKMWQPALSNGNIVMAEKKDGSKFVAGAEVNTTAIAIDSVSEAPDGCLDTAVARVSAQLTGQAQRVQSRAYAGRLANALPAWQQELGASARSDRFVWPAESGGVQVQVEYFASDRYNTRQISGIGDLVHIVCEVAWGNLPNGVQCTFDSGAPMVLNGTPLVVLPRVFRAVMSSRQLAVERGQVLQPQDATLIREGEAVVQQDVLSDLQL